MTSAPLDRATRERVWRTAVAADAARPVRRHLEFSVITSEVAERAPFPAPFEFHFSEMSPSDTDSDESSGRSRLDPDLTVHFATVVRHGIVLGGQPIEAVFRLPRMSDFLDALRSDLDWMLSDDRLEAEPVYAVLNLCRLLVIIGHDEPQVVGKLAAAEATTARLGAESAHAVEAAVRAFTTGDAWHPSAAERRAIEGLAQRARRELHAAHARATTRSEKDER